mmetsp:Transcript_17180/g.37070  ORF Transcript_17180/g.37070 Transcript_17180/m.37070 type:complete len:231 (-) Transcript_17180:469-1161(-)
MSMFNQVATTIEMTTPSPLDLTGQASEDESASRELATSQRNNARSGDNDDGDERTRGTLTRYLPSPVDLWRSFTPTSLLLLPLVFTIYVVLQLPLHYGSSTEKDQWKGRGRDVDKLATDLRVVEKDLHQAEEDHLEIKAATKDLRRRVDRMKERRRYMQEEGNARRERERLEKEREVFEKIRAEEEERQAEVGCRRGGTDSERDDGQGDSAGHTSGEDPTLIVYDTEKGN